MVTCPQPPKPVGDQGGEISRSCSSAGEGAYDESRSTTADSLEQGRRIGSARPQVLKGREVWPGHWGLTRQQLLDLLARLRGDPDWDSKNIVYALVRDFIVPWTRGSGLGYALSVNKTEPKEVNVMVSHAFAENAEDFLESVVRATDDGDVVYICALANYQAEDEAGPSIAEQLGSEPSESPFWRVLVHIKESGDRHGRHWRQWALVQYLPLVLLLGAVLFACMPIMIWEEEFQTWYHGTLVSLDVINWWWFRSLPCAGSLLVLAILLQGALCLTRCIYLGRMLVVPNNEIDIYTRLWCVYEIFTATRLGVPTKMAPTLACGGKSKCESARCSNRTDTDRIRGEIQACEGGYEKVDAAIRCVMRGVRRHTVGTWTKYAILQILPGFSCFIMEHTHEDLAFAPLVLVAYTITACLFVSYVKRIRGRLHISFPALVLMFLCTIGVVYFHVVSMQEPLVHMKFVPWLSFFCTEAATFIIVPILILKGSANSVTFWRRTLIAALYVMFWASRMLMWRRTFQDRFLVARCAFYAWKATMPLYILWTEALHFGCKAITTQDNPRVVAALAWAIMGVWCLLCSGLDLWLWGLVS